MGESDDHIHAKLCDFGMARTFDRDGGESSDGESPPPTPGRKASFCAMSCDYYTAPEVCAVGSAHQPSADIYSLGVTLYILICGFPPVFAADNNTTSSSCQAGRGQVVFPETQWGVISEEAKDLLRKMLHPDPTKRISAENALQDKWIVQHLSAASLPPSSRSSWTIPQSVSVGDSSTPPLARSVDMDQVRNRLYKAMARMNEESTPTPKTVSSSGSSSNINNRRRKPSSSKGTSATTSREKTMMKKRFFKTVVSPRKKRRLECHRRSSIVCAMAELYCDMAAVSSASAATSRAAATGIDHKKSNKDDDLPPPPAVSAV